LVSPSLSNHNSSENNKVDGLIIFDLEDNEMDEILHIKNSIHRKRLRNGTHFIPISSPRNFNPQAVQTVLRESQKEDHRRKYSPLSSSLPLDNENQADLYSHSPNLSTSVFNNQQSKVLSIKSNQLYNSNLQTAQKRDLENIFNTNALANNYDIEIGNINPSKNYNLVTLYRSF
jgi:hypothetical protein